MRPILFLCLLLTLVISNSVKANTDVSNSINEPTVWTLAGSPYVINSSYSNYAAFSVNAELTIEEGVEVHSTDHLVVRSGGKLNADGVTFTIGSPTQSYDFKVEGGEINITNSSIDGSAFYLKNEGSGVLRNNSIVMNRIIVDGEGSSLSTYSLSENSYSNSAFEIVNSIDVPTSLDVVDGVSKYVLNTSYANYAVFSVNAELTIEEGVEVHSTDHLIVRSGGKLNADGVTFTIGSPAQSYDFKVEGGEINITNSSIDGSAFYLKNEGSGVLRNNSIVMNRIIVDGEGSSLSTYSLSENSYSNSAFEIVNSLDVPTSLDVVDGVSKYVLNTSYANYAAFSVNAELTIEEGVEVHSTDHLVVRSGGKLNADGVTFTIGSPAQSYDFKVEGGEINITNSSIDGSAFYLKNEGSGVLRNNSIVMNRIIVDGEGSSLSTYSLSENSYSNSAFEIVNSIDVPTSLDVVDGVSKYVLNTSYANYAAFSVNAELTIEEGVEVHSTDHLVVRSGGKLNADGVTFTIGFPTQSYDFKVEGGEINITNSSIDGSAFYLKNEGSGVLRNNSIVMNRIIVDGEGSSLSTYSLSENSYSNSAFEIVNSIDVPTSLDVVDGVSKYVLNTSYANYAVFSVNAALTIEESVEVHSTDHLVVRSGGKLNADGVTFTIGFPTQSYDFKVEGGEINIINSTINGTNLYLNAPGSGTLSSNSIHIPLKIAGTNYQVDNNAFFIGSQPAITIEENGNYVFRSNDFYGTSTQIAVQNNSESGTVEIIDSYFGTPTGPFLPTVNPSGLGPSVYGNVNIPSWVSSANNPSLAPPVKVHINILGNGSVISSAGDIECLATSCELLVDAGVDVTLQPLASPNYAFSSWTLPECELQLNCTFVANSNTELTVEFALTSDLISELKDFGEFEHFVVYEYSKVYDELVGDKLALNNFLRGAWNVLKAGVQDKAFGSVGITLGLGNNLLPLNWFGTIRKLYSELGGDNQWHYILFDSSGNVVPVGGAYSSGEVLYPVIFLRTRFTLACLNAKTSSDPNDDSLCDELIDTGPLKLEITGLGTNEQYNARQYSIELETGRGISGLKKGIRDVKQGALYMVIPRPFRVDFESEDLLPANNLDAGFALDSQYGYRVKMNVGNRIPLLDDAVGLTTSTAIGHTDYYAFTGAFTLTELLNGATGQDPNVFDSDGDGVVDILEFADLDADGILDVHEGSVLVPGIGDITADKVKNLMAMRTRYSGNVAISSYDDFSTCPAVSIGDSNGGEIAGDTWVYSNKGRITLGGLARTRGTPSLSYQCGQVLEASLVNLSNRISHGLSDFVIHLDETCEEADMECRTAEVIIKLAFPLTEPETNERLVYRKFYAGDSGWRNYQRVYSSSTGLDWEAKTEGLLTPGDTFIRLILTDGGDGDADGELNGVILDPGAPVYVIGATANINAESIAYEGSSATLDGSASQPANENGMLDFRWSQISGIPVLIDDETASSTSFEIPQVEDDQEIIIQLIVTENGIESEPARKAITILNVNNPPQVRAGEDQSVTEGDIVTISASATDADGHSLEFTWVQESGSRVDLTGADTDTASFIAPETDVSIELVFRVSVSDGEDSAEDTVIITVNRANQSPTVNAGDDQTVVEGSSVTLYATASDADNDSLTYSWTQVTGESVSINNPNNIEATFTAPQVTNKHDLEFKLTVTDGKATATDTVKVTVTNKAEASTTQTSDRSSDSGGGGSLGIILILMMLTIIWTRQEKYEA